MQKTRIICTIGPATESYDMLQKLYEAGMSIARLNMSHGDHDSHAKVIQHIKTLNKKVKFPVPILLDTQGPAIRTGDLSNELDLRQGRHGKKLKGDDSEKRHPEGQQRRGDRSLDKRRRDIHIGSVVRTSPASADARRADRRRAIRSNARYTTGVV